MLSLAHDMENNNFYDNCVSPATIFINILEEFILIISNSRDLEKKNVVIKISRTSPVWKKLQ